MHWRGETQTSEGLTPDLFCTGAGIMGNINTLYSSHYFWGMNHTAFLLSVRHQLSICWNRAPDVHSYFAAQLPLASSRALQQRWEYRCSFGNHVNCALGWVRCFFWVNLQSGFFSERWQTNKKPEAQEEQSSPVTPPAAQETLGEWFSLSSSRGDPLLLHRTQKLVHVPLVLS